MWARRARTKTKPKPENMLHVLSLDVSVHCAASLKRIKYHILRVMKGDLWMLQPQGGDSGTLRDGRFRVDSVIRPALLTLLSQIPSQLSTVLFTYPWWWYWGIRSAHLCHAELIFRHMLFSWVSLCLLYFVAVTHTARVGLSSQCLQIQVSHYQTSYFTGVVLRGFFFK